ncbi:hypothetical protein Avbf_05068 [Armadillidium vulgare]|nr:hypothetical protein Avbf_05068 [Armadillidium vulgare]
MASGYTKISIEGQGVSNYGSTTEASHSRNFSTEFFQHCDKITTNLFTINKGTTNLERSKKLIGTPSDSQMLRDRM